MKTVVTLGVLALIALGVGYYFLVVTPKRKSQEGSLCSSKGDGVNDGKIVNGVCIKSSTRNVSGLESIGIGQSAQLAPFKKDDVLYINNAYTNNDVFIYTFPKAEGIYLIGNTRHSWYGSQPIGTFVEMAGTDWARIHVSNFMIYQYNGGAITKITQDVFVPIKEIAKTPY